MVCMPSFIYCYCGCFSDSKPWLMFYKMTTIIFKHLQYQFLWKMFRLWSFLKRSNVYIYDKNRKIWTFNFNFLFEKLFTLSWIYFYFNKIGLGEELLVATIFEPTPLPTERSLFSESMMHFSHCPKNVPKTILKKRFWNCIFFRSADSDCTAVSKGGKIQNTKFRIGHSTFFGQWK